MAEVRYRTKEEAIKAVKKDGRALEFVSEELRNNKEVVLIAVTNLGRALKFASEERKNDEDIAKAALTQNGLVLEYLSIRLQNNPDIVKVALINNVYLLRYIDKDLSKQILNDEKIVLEIKQAMIENVKKLIENYNGNDHTNYIKKLHSETAKNIKFFNDYLSYILLKEQQEEQEKQIKQQQEEEKKKAMAKLDNLLK